MMKSSPHKISVKGNLIIAGQLGHSESTVISGVSKIDHIHFGVRSPEINFTGRFSELASLEKFFQPSSVTKPFITVVSGLGGIGKTQLIRKFIDQKRSYENVIWINAETIESINESFKKLAEERLNISTTNKKDSESIIAEVLDRLCQKKSFFVYDNVETIESVKFVLTVRSSGENPHIVITSRIQQFDDGINVIQLKEWELKEAKLYVTLTLENPNDLDSDIKLLVKMLQCFPLALRQATSYIKYHRKTEMFPISDYIAICHTQEMLDSPTFQQNTTNLYMKTTLTTWSITIDAIQRDEANGPLAIRVLNIMAYFAPDNIRRDFFRRLRGDYQDNVVGWDKQLKSAVSLLVNYSMIDSQDMESILSIHRLVQEVIKVKLSQTDRDQEVLQNALTLISKLINDAKDKNIYPHAVSVFLFALKFPDLVREFMTLPSSILGNLKDNGKYNQGKVFGDAILEPLSTILTNNYAVLLKIKYDIAAACIYLGLDANALQRNQEILKEQSILLGEDHPDTLETKSNVAFSNRVLGNHTLSLQLFEEVFQKMKLTLGEEHPDTLRSMSNVAFSNRELGNHALALQSYEELLQKQKSILGDDDPDTLITMSHIARSNIELGNKTLALQSYEEIFQKQKTLLGEDHPETLRTMSNIASSNRELGDLTLALQLYEQNFEKRKVILGEDHPETLRTMSNIAFSNRELGNYTLALQSFEGVFQKQKSILGENHPETLATMSNIAFSNRQLGNHTLALQMYEENFDKRKSVLGEDHPNTLRAMSNIASSNRELGNNALALQLFEKVFRKQKHILGEDHLDTVKTMSDIAVSNRDLGNHVLGLQLFEGVFQKQKSIFGDDHPETLKTMSDIASSNRELGNPSLALQLFEEIFRKQKSQLGEDHPDTLKVMSNIAFSNKEIGNHDLALEFFEKVLQKQKSILGEDHRDVLITMSNIANLQLEMPINFFM